MQSKYLKLFPTDADYKRVWDDYKRFFGERPPAGNSQADYDAAAWACESVELSRIAPTIKAEPVKEWPSQAEAKAPKGRG